MSLRHAEMIVIGNAIHLHPPENRVTNPCSPKMRFGQIECTPQFFQLSRSGYPWYIVE